MIWLNDEEEKEELEFFGSNEYGHSGPNDSPVQLKSSISASDVLFNVHTWSKYDW